MRKKQNFNNPRAKQSQNVAREKQTPLRLKEELSVQNAARETQAFPIKEELLQENAVMELDDVSDEDMNTAVPNDLQDKLTSTVFGARLKKKLMMEQEAARKQKEEASATALGITVKVEEVEHSELSSKNDIVKKDILGSKNDILKKDPEDALQISSCALTPKSEVPDTSSLPRSTASSSRTNLVDDINPYHRRAPKRDLSEKRDFLANPEQHKRRRIEEDRYRREEDASQHHNGNFKYDDVRYNSESFKNNDYAKSSMKYTDPRYMDHSRGESHGGHHQVRGGGSKSMYRSNGSDPRYFDRRPDRPRMEESRIYNDKYDKRREDGWARESDKWIECSRKIDNLRNKIECRVGGSSEYNNYTSHSQLDGNLKRFGRTSRSPEKQRSRSTGRRSREKDFDKPRSRTSKSTDKFINAMSTVDERESGQELQSTCAENFKGFEAEVRNSRDAKLEVPPDSSRIVLPNEATSDKISSEIRESCLLLCTERPGHVDTQNGELQGRPLKKLVSQMETSDTHKSHRSRRTSREKKLDKRPSKRSKSTDKFINATSRLDQRQPEQERQSTPVKESEDFRDSEAEIKNSRDAQSGVPSDSSRSSPPNEVITDKMSLNKIAESDAILCMQGPDHVDTKNVETLGRPLEKLVGQMEASAKQSSRSSREKEFDKPLSRTSKSTDKFINQIGTVDKRESDQAHHITRDKNVEPNVENRRDAQKKIPPDFSSNDPPSEVSTEKKSSEASENCLIPSTERPIHADTTNAKSAGVSVEKLVSQMESSEKHRSHSSSKRSREKESDKRRSKTSKSTDKSINAMSTVVERQSDQNNHNARAKHSDDSEVMIRNGHDAQTKIASDCSRNDLPNEVASEKNSSIEIAENKLRLCTKDLGHGDTKNAASTGEPLEQLVSQIETSEKHRSHSSSKRSREKEFDRRRSKTPKSDVRNSRDIQLEVRPDCSRNSPPNEVAIHKTSASEITDKGLPSCTDGPVHVDAETAESAGLPVAKLVSEMESSEKHRTHSSTKRSSEKESDKRRSKSSRSTNKVMNVMSTVVARETGQEHHNPRAKGSKDFEVKIKTNRDVQPEVPADCTRTSPPNDVESDKISASQVAETGSSSCTKVDVDVQIVASAEMPLEEVISQVESSEKHRNHSSSIKSTEKEFDKRRQKTSKSTDKFSNAMRKVDGRESGQDHQSTRATDCKDVVAEVRNSRDAEPKVSSDYSKNDPPNEVTTHKVCSRETVENSLLSSRGATGRFDKGNTESAELPLEKLVNRVETSEKHKTHSSKRRSTEKEFDKQRSKTTVEKQESGQECQSTRFKDSRDVEAEVRNSRDPEPAIAHCPSTNTSSNKVVIDKVSSSEIAEKCVPAGNSCPVHVDMKIGEPTGQPLERLGNHVETSEKHRSHSSRRKSTEKEFDKRRLKISKSTDKLINPMSTVDEQETDHERQRTGIKDPKDLEPEVKNSRDTQPEIPSDFSRNNSPNEVTADKISVSEIAEKGSSSGTKGPDHVDIKNAELLGEPGEKRVANRVDSSEKHRCHGIKEASEEKELNGRRSKTSRCTDKSIKPMSTVDGQESGEEPQSTPAKGYEDFKAEVRNSQDDQPGVPSDSLRNSSPNEVVIDKISSSDASEKDLPSGAETPVHADIKNDESASHPVEKLYSQVETSEKNKSLTIRRSSRENDLDNRRSKSTDKFINSTTTVNEQETGQERQSTTIKHSKDSETDIRNSHVAQPEVCLDSLKNDLPKEVATDKISSSEAAEKSSPSRSEKPVHADIENTESTERPVKNLVSQMPIPDVSMAVLENDSEVESIQSAIPERAALGSGSFREEKIENIEKFINDYKETEESCLPIANGETDESENLGISTSSIVDTLTMDVEDSAAEQKSESVPIEPSHESRMATKDSAGDTESTIPRCEATIAESISSEQPIAVCEKETAPETSETNPNTVKYATDKVAVVKLKKYQPRIPCVTTLSSYPRRKPSAWADSGSGSRIVKSRPSMNTGEDNKSRKEGKTREITMKNPSLQSIDNSTKKLDSKISIAKKQIEGTTLLTGMHGKTSSATSSETTNANDDSRTRDDVDFKVGSSENNSASVSSTANNIPLQQTKTSPKLSDKSDAASELNSAHESVEVRETRLTGKSILAEPLSIDSKLSNRKKALPKEVDSQTEPAAKPCKIVVTARRRRNMQLEDSCTATTLVPSVDDVNSIEPVKTVSVSNGGPELANVVSEPVKKRKRRSTDK